VNTTELVGEIDMESNNIKFPDDPAVTLTIRLIMQGKVSHLHTNIDSHRQISYSFRFLIDSIVRRFRFRLRLIIHYAHNWIEIYPSIVSYKSSCKSFIFMIFHEEFAFRILFSFSPRRFRIFASSSFTVLLSLSRLLPNLPVCAKLGCCKSQSIDDVGMERYTFVCTKRERKPVKSFIAIV
jgi:hypothetical protein